MLPKPYLQLGPRDLETESRKFPINSKTSDFVLI